MPKRVLILGGTGEATELARRLHETQSGRAEVILSLAGLVDPAKPHPCAIRTGGFGGIEGLERYLKAEAIDLVIDATHPFAEAISTHAYCACQRTEVPRLMLVRPPWTPQAGDRWLQADSLERTAEVLPQFARRVLLVVGRRGVEAFKDVEGIHFVVRLIEPPDEDLPLADYTVVTGRPPHPYDEERALMEDHAIDTMVVKQSGGGPGRAKLTAARDLKVKVVLVDRPPLEPGLEVASVEEAMAWIEEQV